MLMEQLGLDDEKAKVLTVPMSKDALAGEDIHRKLGEDDGKLTPDESKVEAKEEIPKGEAQPSKKKPGFSCVDSFSMCNGDPDGGGCKSKECRESGHHLASDILPPPQVSPGFRWMQVVEASDSDSDGEEGWTDCNTANRGKVAAGEEIVDGLDSGRRGDG